MILVIKLGSLRLRLRCHYLVHTFHAALENVSASCNVILSVVTYCRVRRAAMRLGEVIQAFGLLAEIAIQLKLLRPGTITTFNDA